MLHCFFKFQSKYVFLYLLNLTFLFYTELLGTPIGTGTLYVINVEDSEQEWCTNQNVRCENVESWMTEIRNQTLYKEKRKTNRATETNESLVVQYIVFGGYYNLPFANNEHRSIFKVGSSCHAGTGQLTWGMTAAQKCDLTLSFRKENDNPALVHFINYHGSYYHYTGHLNTCPLATASTTYEERSDDIIMDMFRNRYALHMSMVHPENVRFKYNILYECELFHGSQSFKIDNCTYNSLKKAVTSQADHIYNYKYNLIYNVEKLLREIMSGGKTGFITIVGGEEQQKKDATDYFGFCVQSYTPKLHEISQLTKQQLKHFKHLHTDEEVKTFLEKKQIGLTLNSCTFHSEETISTDYLKWLISNRGFWNFTVTHFLEYKFVTHSKAFLEPLLQERHSAKLRKDHVSAECLKLICNGSYGYNALESSNYNTCRLITATNLKRAQTSISAFLSLDRVQLIGIVEIKKKKTNKERRNEFEDNEAVEDNNEEDENGFDDDDDEEGKNFDFLYSVIVSGKHRPIKNSLPKAVSILSNSKTLFLDHIQTLLSCLDPRLAELCYIDTDSCIFSLTNPSLEDCLLKNKQEHFKKKNILVKNENCPESFHGKLKCEGTYLGGHFRTIKIYRLYSKKDFYTRCKGINRHQADHLPNKTFDHRDLGTNTLQRHALRPTAAGEMCIVHESRSLACPINLKRFVLADEIHTIPLSMAMAWTQK